MSNKRRWLKNTNNGRVIAWSVAQAAKYGLVECDKDGRLVVEHMPVNDKDVVKVLEDKVRENERLKKEISLLKRDIKEYHRLHGPLEQQVPETDVNLAATDPISSDERGERIAEHKAQDDFISECMAKTKRELVELLKEKGVNATVSTTKKALTQKLVDLEG